jgi:Ribonuclease G/E
MKGTEILLGDVAGREAAALIVDGELEDLRIDGAGPRLGAIYRARFDRPAKGQGGAFLKGPDDPLFLRQSKGLKQGDTFLVQVSGTTEPGKAQPVTTRLLFKSRYAIVTPDAPGMNISRSIKDDELRLNIRAAAETELAEHSPHGIVLRSACADAAPEAISEDVDTMLGLANQVLADEGTAPEMLLDGDGPHALAWRDWPDAPARDADLTDWLAPLRSPRVPLDNQSFMFVEHTRALIAVDVNTGADMSPQAGLKANIAAARALPRALRLRGLAGQVVIDFAPMPKKERKTIEASLRAALKTDQVETSLVGWTPLGHLELSRKRDRPALHEVLT